MKMKLIPVAALAVAFVIALYGCGGSGQSQQSAKPEASSPAAAAPAATSAPVETSAPAAAPAAATATVDTAEVNPELIAAGEELKGLAEQYIAEVNKALESGDYKPYQEKIDALTNDISAVIDKITPLIPQDDPNSPDLAYYTAEIMPVVLGDYSDAAFKYADMLMASL